MYVYNILNHLSTCDKYAFVYLNINDILFSIEKIDIIYDMEEDEDVIFLKKSDNKNETVDQFMNKLLNYSHLKVKCINNGIKYSLHNILYSNHSVFLFFR